MIPSTSSSRNGSERRRSIAEERSSQPRRPQEDGVLGGIGLGFGYFGPKNVGSVYGLMLTAWGVAGIVGPTLIAKIRESTGAYSNACM